MYEELNIETIKMNICENTHLPPRGWIQGCVWCCIPTSRTTFFTTSKTVEANYDLHVHLCKDCENYKILEELKNRKKISAYIEQHYLIPCRPDPPDTSPNQLLDYLQLKHKMVANLAL